jgi:hypothetical protein
VAIRCQGGYALSASFGDIDLLTNPIIAISTSATPPIEIAFQPGGGILKARFAGDVPSRGAVLLVPSFPTFSGPLLMHLLPLEALKSPSEAVFSGLAPGEYTVCGLSDFDVAFRDATFLRFLSGGTTVRIEDGKTTEVTVEKVCE